MDTPLLTIDNLHHESCGTAPSILKRNGDDHHLGYFENEHGEQFVLEVNRSTGEGILQAGDLGWGCKIKIRDNTIQGDVVLGGDEWQWLLACWKAATGCKLQSVNNEKDVEVIDDGEDNNTVEEEEVEENDDDNYDDNYDEDAEAAKGVQDTWSQHDKEKFSVED